MGLFQPGLPFLRKALDGLLSKGGTITIPPATVTRPSDPVGAPGIVPPMITVPNKEVTVTRPNGILRDPVVLTMIAGATIWPLLDKLWPDSWGPFPFSPDNLGQWLVGAVPFLLGIVTRILNKNTTRG